MNACETDSKLVLTVGTTCAAPLLPGGKSNCAPAPLLTATLRDRPPFVQILTLVLWAGCLLIGALGFAIPYTRPQQTKIAAIPVQVELLNVELTDEPLPEAELPPANLLTAPSPPDAVAEPQLPQTIAVAAPSPAIAFALPVEGQTRVVEVSQASYSRVPATNAVITASAMPVQSLTFGQGDGRQPEPEYPSRSKNEGQEGVVGVRFTVAENGRVTAAETTSPSRWPLLNDSALRTIRSRWRFPVGATRAYEVRIRFQLQK